MERDRFFIDTEGGGKWVLIRQGAKRPMRSFSSDDEVTDICRNAQALLPDAGVDADEARTALAGITLTRTVAR